MFYQSRSHSLPHSAPACVALVNRSAVRMARMADSPWSLRCYCIGRSWPYLDASGATIPTTIWPCLRFLFPTFLNHGTVKLGAKNHSFNRNPIYKIQINCRYQIVWLDFALTLAFVFPHKNIIMGNLLRDLQNLCTKQWKRFHLELEIGSCCYNQSRCSASWVRCSHG